MDLLFIWNYHYFPFEKGKSRFSDLLNALAAKGYRIEVVCSSFYHMGKSFRKENDEQFASLPYQVTLIPELGYSKNVSLKRWRSIRRFNKGVKHYLREHKPVDFVYIPIPSNELALIGEEFATRVGAKVVLDIEDLWPESFKMIPLIKPVYPLLFSKSAHKRQEALSRTDGIVAVSKTYLELGQREAGKNVPSAFAPIGADFAYVSALKAKHTSKKPAGEFWVGYIGTLSKSYDLYTAIDAIDALAIAHFDNIVLKIMGSGPDLEKVKKYASTKQGRIEFIGLLPYEEMCSLLFDCDVGLNPIISTSVSSLINKVADYAACGVPVLNSQPSREYQDLLRQYNAGWEVWPQDCISLQKEIIFAMKHPKELAKKRAGTSRMASEVFDRKDSQNRIMQLLETIRSEKQ